MARITEVDVLYAMAEVWDYAWNQECEYGMPMQQGLRMLADLLGEEFELAYQALLSSRRGW